MFPLLPTFDVLAVQSSAQPQYSSVSDELSKGATLLAANDLQQSIEQAKGTAVSAATSTASSSVQKWLSQFGTADVQLNVDQDGNWDQSSLDLLVPLYDDEKSLLFSQFGLRAPDSRVTTNIGFGVRTFYLENWMFGGNFFFDDDLTGKNRRVGIGAEAWTNYLKFSANSYVGTSEWHHSRDLSDYDEKPADGYDVRAEGWLPAVPSLGAKVMYEQYYGDNVALFDTDHLQHNPSAVTVGVSYTPVPLITLATNYRRGQDELNDTQFQIGVKYDFAHDWQYQFSPENVATMRTLAGTRYDLVERNNAIVLQYKKRSTQGVSKLLLQTVTDDSPADGLAQNTLQAQALDDQNNPVVNAPIQWAVTGSAKPDTAAGTTDAQGIALVNITDTAEETINVTAKSGSVSSTLPSKFQAVTASSLTLTVDKNGAAADGVATDEATATVLDINHRPVNNAKLMWTVDDPATLRDAQTTTDEQGTAQVKISSLKAGENVLTARTGELQAQKTVQFVVNSQQANIVSFDIITDNSAANGLATDTALVTVADPAGNPVVNEPVQVGADKKTVVFTSSAQAAKTSAPAQTDDKGQLLVSFSDTVAEAVVLTATLNNGNSKPATAHFVADAATEALEDLSLQKDNSPANGTTQNQAVVYVRDKNHNPVSGVNVNWQSNRSTVAFSASAPTDANGMTTVNFTDTVAETAAINASLPNGSELSVDSHFLADMDTAALYDLQVTKDGSIADGVDTNTAQVYVRDAKGNPISDQQVTWSSDSSSTSFTPQNVSQTDAQGKAVIAYNSKVAQTLQLTAALSNGQKSSASSFFISDANSERITHFEVTSGAVADGKATNVANVVVKDANGNPIKNEDVTWSVNGSAQLSAAQSTTNDNGEATVSLTDLRAEKVSVMVKIKSGATETGQSEFIADKTTAKISELTATTGALANGTATNSSTIVVVDAYDNPLSQMTVSWKVKTGQALLAAAQTTTDDKGQSTVTFTDEHAETITLTATLDDGETKDVNSEFVADSENPVIASLQMITDNQPADGKKQDTAEIVVQDSKHNPIKNSLVTWYFGGSTTISAPTASTSTDSEGKARASFADTVEETINLKATLKNGVTQTVPAHFVADVATATINLTMVTDGQLADGTMKDVIRAKVTDSLGHALKNQTINWQVENSTTAVIDDSSQTDDNGETQVNVTDSTAEAVSVVATLASNAQATSKITANFHHHTVTSFAVVGTSKQPADGKSPITFQAYVTDDTGAPVKNTPVDFTTTGTSVLTFTTVNTDTEGSAVVRLTDLEPETVTVTAKSGDDKQDTGKSQTATFTPAAITGIEAGGYTFAPDAGFPSVGFLSGTFNIIIDGDKANASRYTWKANQSWIYIDEPGKIRLYHKTTYDAANTVVITATPISGHGITLTYTFTIKHWMKSMGHTGTVTEMAQDCINQGMQLPDYHLLSNTEPETDGVRAVGSLWGEWGNLSQYSWSYLSSAQSMWSSTVGKNNTNIYVSWRSGHVFDTVPDTIMDETCQAY